MSLSQDADDDPFRPSTDLTAQRDAKKKKQDAMKSNHDDDDDDDEDKQLSSSSDNDADDAETNVDYRQQARFQTWRKHTRDIYRICMHLEPAWPCQTVQFLPYMMTPQTATSSSSGVAGQHKQQTLLAGTTTQGQEQQYLKLLRLELPAGPNPPPNCGVLDTELNHVGGYGYGPKYINFHVSSRFFHNGDVVRVRYMPANPNIFLTASSDGHLYLFDNALLPYNKKPNNPGRPTLPPPPSEPANPSNSDRYKNEMWEYRKREKEQDKWDRETRGAGQHRVRLVPGAAAAASSNPLLSSAAGTDGSNNAILDPSGANAPKSCEWHALRGEGHLAAGFPSGAVAEWNFANEQPPAKVGDVVDIDPRTVRWCPSTVYEVQYATQDENLLAAACADGATHIWDARNSGSNASSSSQPAASSSSSSSSSGAALVLNKTVQSGEAATTLAWSIFDKHLLAVGYSSGATRLWDLRNVGSQPIATYMGSSPDHGDSKTVVAPRTAFSSHRRNTEVTSLQWSPHDRAVLATGGEDGYLVWVDTLKQRCMFVHSGHTSSVHDMCWCWHDAFAGLMVSCDDHGIIAWTPRTQLLE